MCENICRNLYFLGTQFQQSNLVLGMPKIVTSGIHYFLQIFISLSSKTLYSVISVKILLTQNSRREEKMYQFISLPIMSPSTIDTNEKTDMVLNYPIGGSEIHNENEEAKIFDDNEIEINYKNTII